MEAIDATASNEEILQSFQRGQPVSHRCVAVCARHSLSRVVQNSIDNRGRDVQFRLEIGSDGVPKHVWSHPIDQRRLFKSCKCLSAVLNRLAFYPGWEEPVSGSR